MKDKDDSKAHPNDAERLFRLRTSMGLKKKEMASLLGCTARTIHNYENAITKMPLHLRRLLRSISGLDVNPSDPEEGPYLITARYREMHNAEELTATPDQSPVQRSLLTRIKRFRVSSRERLRNELTPARRAIENTIFTAYLTAAAVIAIELFQRSIGGWQTHQLYHDILLAGSLLTAFLLVLPAWLTTSWGTKAKMP
ncbi:MAG: helix-turn-helix transcriptional regulator [Pseudomonadota bacterium]